MKAGILAIGTELLMGQTVNTNAAEISKALSALGIGVYLHYTVGDNRERMASHLKKLMTDCDLVITTGGLGPTQDDITKEVVADVLGMEMTLDQKSLDYVKSRFKKFNRIMPESNVRQAYFPSGATILDNEKGTAPACLIETEAATVVVLPGPPSEMKHVLQKHILPYLQKKVQPTMHSAYLSVYDMGESMVEEKLLSLIDQQVDPTLATYAGEGKVLLRITSSSGTIEENKIRVASMTEQVIAVLGHHVVSCTGEDLPEVLMKQLVAMKKTVTFAESCTGGKIASSLIALSGASEVVHSGIVCYSNDSKERYLNVPEDVIARYGAVSSETCERMTEGVLKLSGADYSIAVTGIAGPSGGTEEKPVGLVYIGIGSRKGIQVFKEQFFGDREQIQNRVVLKALKRLYDNLQNM